MSRSQVELLIESRCEDFQSAYEEGNEPRIEDFLKNDLQKEDLQCLFEELLLIERDQRLESGHSCERHQYLSRFPEFTEIIERILANPADALTVTIADNSWITSFDEKPTLENYEILDELGRGGMGVVYKAKQVELNRLVALKFLLHTGSAQEDLDRFHQEAQAIAELNHSNIVKIYDIGTSDQGPWFSLEYLNGGSLDAQLQGKPQMPNEAAQLIQQLAEAMHYAHQHDIVHRDLKPANILLEKPEHSETIEIPFNQLQSKITDFGLAKRLDVTSHTRENSLMGTLLYMAPEQAEGNTENPITPATDIHALGTILYECLTGNPPFRGTTVAQVIQLIQAQEAVPPSHIQPTVPKDLETICLKCLQKEPEKRYATAKELADDLERFLNNEPIKARPVSVMEKAIKWVRRNRIVASLIIGVFASLSVGLICSLFFLWKSIEATDAEAIMRRTAEANERTAKQNEEKAKKEKQRAEKLSEDLATELQTNGLKMANQALQQHRIDDAKEPLQQVPRSRREFAWHRLELERRLSKAVPVEILHSHDWSILDGLISSDNQISITAGQDGQLLLHNLTTRSITAIEEGMWHSEVCYFQPVGLFYHLHPKHRHEFPMCYQDLCWIKEKRSFAAAALSGEGVVYHVEEKRKETILQAKSSLNCVASLAKSPLLLFGDNQGRLYPVNHEQAKMLPILTLGPSPIARILPVRDQAWLIGQEDGTVSLLNAEATSVLTKISVQGPLHDLTLDEGQLRLAIGCAQNPIPLFKLDLDKPTFLPKQSHYSIPKTEAGQLGIVDLIRFSPQGNALLAVDNHRRLHAWDLLTRQSMFITKIPGTHRLSADELERVSLPQRRQVNMLQFVDEKSFYTAGSGTHLLRWQWDREQGITKFEAGEFPLMQFDLHDPELLWVGDKNGKLSIYHSRTGKEITTVDAHCGPILSVGRTAKTGIILTCGEDGHILRWKRSSKRIVQAGPEIIHTQELLHAAISPDGSKIVAYDVDNQVQLWNTSGQLQKSVDVQQQEEDGFVTGLIEFNKDGTQFSIAGQGQLVWILSAEDLLILKRPYMAAALGCTAMVWHPRQELLIGGDSDGRLRSFPPSSIPNIGSKEQASAMAFTPDGKRFAAGGISGSFLIMDLDHAGLVLRRVSKEGQIVDLKFDETGTRLALAHADGTISIYESAQVKDTPVYQGKPSSQCETIDIADVQNGGLWFAPNSLVFDQVNRSHLIYVKAHQSKEKNSISVRQGILHNGRYSEKELLNNNEVPPRLMQQHSWGRALYPTNENVYTVLRVPRPKLHTHVGELRLFSHRLKKRGANWTLVEETPRREVISPPGNIGFWPHLYEGPNGKPLAFDFYYGWYQLEATWWDKDAWTGWWNTGAWARQTIGKQGDGKAMRMVQGSDGRIHMFFFNSRFGGDLTCGMYQCVESKPPFRIVHRERIDTNWGMSIVGFCLGEGDVPCVLYHRQNQQRGKELVFAQFRDGKWTREVLDGNQTTHYFSSPAYNHKGQIGFLTVEHQTGEIQLIVKENNQWTKQQLLTRPELPKQSYEEGARRYPNLYADRNGNWVLLVREIKGTTQALKIYRPITSSSP